jgi:hypothetical protein
MKLPERAMPAPVIFDFMPMSVMASGGVDISQNVSVGKTAPAGLSVYLTISAVLKYR